MRFPHCAALMKTVLFGFRRPMWYTHSKRTFMVKFSVLSWWVTSVQRKALTHSVSYISLMYTHTISELFLSTSSRPVLCSVFISVVSLSPTEALIAAINSDIEEAKVKLELPEHLKLKEDNFFTSAPSSSASIAPCSTSTSQTILNGHWQLALTAALCERVHTRAKDKGLCHYSNAQSHPEACLLLPWLVMDTYIKNLFFLIAFFFHPSVFLKKNLSLVVEVYLYIFAQEHLIKQSDCLWSSWGEKNFFFFFFLLHDKIPTKQLLFFFFVGEGGQHT